MWTHSPAFVYERLFHECLQVSIAAVSIVATDIVAGHGLALPLSLCLIVVLFEGQQNAKVKKQHCGLERPRTRGGREFSSVCKVSPLDSVSSVGFKD